MRSSVPMSRVLQGDVGSGKTAVAFAVIARVIKAGYNAVFMTPTELLARQHFKIACEFLDCTKFLLTSKTKKVEKDELINCKSPCLILGTHALIHNENLPHIALAIIDEQHKFGVQQRLRLRKAGVHALSMSATPIPRSLYLMSMGYLQTSLLKQKPNNSCVVQTHIKSEDEINSVYDWIQGVLDQGLLVYWVCPRIIDSAQFKMANIEIRAKLLEERFPGRIAVMHSKTINKEEVMQEFYSRHKPILLSTTVIEVGIDIHEAVGMIIEQPERFGLAQLHQLRGRVGRGKWPGTCFLVHQPDIIWPTLKRLKFLEQHHDGFEIAEYDREFRGYGDPLGTMQSGDIGFKFFDPEGSLDSIDEGLLDQPLTEAERILWGKDGTMMKGV